MFHPEWKSYQLELSKNAGIDAMERILTTF